MLEGDAGIVLRYFGDGGAPELGDVGVDAVVGLDCYFEAHEFAFPFLFARAADLPKNGKVPTAHLRTHPFDRVCHRHGSEHRLIAFPPP